MAKDCDRFRYEDAGQSTKQLLCPVIIWKTQLRWNWCRVFFRSLSRSNGKEAFQGVALLKMRAQWNDTDSITGHRTIFNNISDGWLYWIELIQYMISTSLQRLSFRHDGSNGKTLEDRPVMSEDWLDLRTGFYAMEELVPQAMLQIRITASNGIHLFDIPKRSDDDKNTMRSSDTENSDCTRLIAQAEGHRRPAH